MNPKEHYSEYQSTLGGNVRQNPEENNSQLTMPVSGGFLG